MERKRENSCQSGSSRCRAQKKEAIQIYLGGGKRG